MTNNQNVPEATTSVAPETTTETTEAKPDREAAKYRRQLRDTEGERDQLRTRVETMQRREVERIAADQLDRPADLWLAHPDLADLLDESGDLDPGKVTEAVSAVLTDRPTWRRPEPPASFDGGVRQSPPREVSMQDVLQGRRRRA